MAEAMLFTYCICCSARCDVMSVSSILSSLVSVVGKMTISTVCMKCFRHTMWHVLNAVCRYLGVLLLNLVLSIFLSSCLIHFPTHCIVPYFHVVWICFCSNLMVVVVDDITFHSICLGIPSLMWDYYAMQFHVSVNFILYLVVLTV